MKLRSFSGLGMLSFLIFSGCGGSNGELPRQATAVPTQSTPPSNRDALRQIGQQRHGEHIVTLFNETGIVRRGANRFTLEIRNAANELVAVDQLHVETRMEMPGGKPMIGSGSIIPGDAPGRYTIGSDFAARPPIGADESEARAGRMAGTWSLVVTFHPNQRIEFSASLQ